MRLATVILAVAFIISINVPVYSDDASGDKKKSGGMDPALTGMLVGGLLGGGIGTAIGSASGHAGTGALIGAGVGAVGGTVVGASRKDKAQPREEEYYGPEGKPATDQKIKKKVIRTYDEKGNIVSEEEVKN